MVRMVTEVLKHIEAELAHVLDTPTMLALCPEKGTDLFLEKAERMRSGLA